jgi:hypothetical protein
MNTSGRPDRILRRRRVRTSAVVVLVAGLLSSWVPAASAAPTPPPEPVLLEPVGEIDIPDPTFFWEPAGAGDSQATKYRIWIQREFDVPGEDRIVTIEEHDDWYYICFPWCVFRLPEPLASGTHTWYVLAGNDAGWGFWSPGLGFVVP